MGPFGFWMESFLDNPIRWSEKGGCQPGHPGSVEEVLTHSQIEQVPRRPTKRNNIMYNPKMPIIYDLFILSFDLWICGVTCAIEPLKPLT